ncbi:hypothetical protein Pla22_36440 [Rubripirellula amarantea]|uniref:Uncharacterized protein n=1 Tax=Rubripirellula amarantea TaxID=2527999 RepID=A0A5C5WLE8_9BACT|nr:hypothetical protein [Rubripirellula amarantea]TWT50901.1 hypothetical protein Pla22_36440 [Rubripirellula amarantea]
MSNSLASRFGPSPSLLPRPQRKVRKPSKRRDKRVTLRAELLEDRRLLAVVSEMEPNDQLAEATPVQLETAFDPRILSAQVAGTMTSADDVDNFTFSAIAGDTVIVSADDLIACLK